MGRGACGLVNALARLGPAFADRPPSFASMAIDGVEMLTDRGGENDEGGDARSMPLVLPRDSLESVATMAEEVCALICLAS